ncbi:SDR family oxidoreductase [Streptomyces sp. RB6PN25]|uniref:SDR family oxidoreductase n=1 Tax=Streptomyces humicola TaxID=2953240 RepID=A0ABT1PZS4_9ACTN|nr:SDR family oxidoreductase [Streptomyces humicola]MCQ4082628.1 SDR family oxidoreductase [Streptomyces humicola]
MTTSLITGATAGIGAAFARRLASDGHRLVLVARDTKRLDDQAAQLRRDHGVHVEVLAADLSTDDGIAAVEARLADRDRPVDVLVNNAGFGIRGTYPDAPFADELTMLKVHCEAVLRLTTAATQAMRDRGRGFVINVASVAAFVPRGTYAATKAWVVSFTQGAARDLAGSGVRLLALCPGFVRTEFHERAGMNVDGIPGWAWLDADKVVATAIRDLARGRVVSVPDLRYKVAVGLAKVAPSGAFGRVSSTAGRRFGPR